MFVSCSTAGEERVEDLLCHAKGSGSLPAEGKPVNYVSQQPYALFLTVCVPDQFDIRNTHLGQTALICFPIFNHFARCRAEMFFLLCAR